MSAHECDELGVVVEGASDRIFGRPITENPYCLVNAREAHVLWATAWREAEFLLEVRGREEASRWLSETTP